MSQLSQYFERSNNEERKHDEDDEVKNSKVACATSWLRSISKISSVKDSRQNSIVETQVRRESSLRKLSNFIRNR